MNAQVFDVRDMMRGGSHVVREVCHGAVEQGAVFQREQDGTEVTTALGSMGQGHEVVSCCEIPGRKDGVVGKLCHEGAWGSLGIGGVSRRLLTPVVPADGVVTSWRAQAARSPQTTLIVQTTALSVEMPERFPGLPNKPGRWVVIFASLGIVEWGVRRIWVVSQFEIGCLSGLA